MNAWWGLYYVCMTFLPWWQIHIQSSTLTVRLSNEHNSSRYHEKQGRRTNRRGDVFITAPLVLPVSLKVYNCSEGAEMDWSIQWAERVMQIYGGRVFLEDAPQSRSHCDFHKQKGLPCLLLQNRQWRAPSLKDIKKEKEETWVSGTGFVLASYFSCPFFMKDGNGVFLTVNMCVRVCAPALLCFTDTFQSKMKNLQVK